MKKLSMLGVMAIQHMATATAASIVQRSMAAIASPAAWRSIALAGAEAERSKRTRAEVRLVVVSGLAAGEEGVWHLVRA